MKKLLFIATLFLTSGKCFSATQIYIPSTSTFHNYQINIATAAIIRLTGGSGALTGTFSAGFTTLTGLSVLNSTTTNTGVFGVIQLAPGAAPFFDGVDRLWSLSGVGAEYDGLGHSFNVGTVSRSTAVFINGNQQLLLSTGTNSLPSLAFIGDPTSGFVISSSMTFFTERGLEAISISTGNRGVALRATAVNDDAQAGRYGESFSTGVLSAGNITGTTVWQNVVSTTLAGGDWILNGQISINGNSATYTQLGIAISQFSGNTTTDQVDGDNQRIQGSGGVAYNATAVNDCTITGYRISLPTSTTVFLKARVIFSGGTPQVQAGRFSGFRKR